MNKSKQKSTENRVRAAYFAIRSYDKEPPTADAVAKMTGLPVDVVEQWMQKMAETGEISQPSS